MARTSLLLVALLSLSAARSAAADDPVRDKLTAAKDAHDAEVARLRTALLESFDKAEEAARAAGNRSGIDRVKAERKAFEDTGKTPNSPAGLDFDKGVFQAQLRLKEAYKVATDAYVKSKRDADADAVEAEFKAAFGPKPATAAPPKKPADPFPVGAVWVGQAKWNADRSAHNYLLVVTDRSGAAFKGIVRLDFANVGNPQEKWLFDVEGTIKGTDVAYVHDNQKITGTVKGDTFSFTSQKSDSLGRGTLGRKAH